MRSKKSFLSLGILALVLFLGVGYAVVSSVYVNLGGTANAAGSNLNVEITNAVATTNISEKTVDFNHVLSDSNLTSNFTLNNMTLGEIVTITYTVTNNETDVDAVLSLASGVTLNNSNPDYFRVDYEITDSTTDLENNDKTMTVVVTVELIKTPVTEENSSTTVGLTLTASPAGSDSSSGSGADSSGDILDNSWPIEWNSMEVVNNTSLADGYIVKISDLAPSLSELQATQLVASMDSENVNIYYIGSGQGYFVEYAYGNAIIQVLSAPSTGDYILDGDTITVSEPGFYVLNVGSKNLYNLNVDFVLEKGESPVLIEWNTLDVVGNTTIVNTEDSSEVLVKVSSETPAIELFSAASIYMHTGTELYIRAFTDIVDLDGAGNGYDLLYDVSASVYVVYAACEHEGFIFTEPGIYSLEVGSSGLDVDCVIR